MEGICDLELGLRKTPHDSHHDDRDQVAQFTMIYNGEVCVWENVSQARAKAILLLAGRGAAEGSRRRTSTSGVDGLTLTLDPPPLPQSLPKSCGSATPAMSLKGCNNATSVMSMKRSLQRFLEKRKLRMQRSHASPY